MALIDMDFALGGGGGEMTITHETMVLGQEYSVDIQNGVYLTQKTDSLAYVSYEKGYIENGVDTNFYHESSYFTKTYTNGTLKIKKISNTAGATDLYVWKFN